MGEANFLRGVLLN